MVCLQSIVWYGQFVTNWCGFIEMPFILHNFCREAWQNLWLSGDTGTLTVNKMALPIEVSAEMVSYSYFYWKKYNCNWVTKLRIRYYCNMSRIRPRLIRCHWSFDPWWVEISGHTEQLRPCGSTLHFVNNRHTRVKTQGASWIGDFSQTDGRRKFRAGNSQKSGCTYIRGVPYIRDKTVHIFDSLVRHWCLDGMGIKTNLFSYNKKNLKMLSVKWWPFC